MLDECFLGAMVDERVFRFRYGRDMLADAEMTNLRWFANDVPAQINCSFEGYLAVVDTGNSGKERTIARLLFGTFGLSVLMKR